MASNLMKKPGRPPKVKPILLQVAKNGITDKPSAPNNIMEMVCDNLKMFKKIFSFFKAYSVNELTFEFAEDKVTIKSKDFNGKCILVLNINCQVLPSYYCKTPFTRCVKRESLEVIFKKKSDSANKNPDNNKVTFILCEEDSRSKMYVLLYNNSLAKTDKYSIDLIQTSNHAAIEIPSDDNYPLSFELPSDVFKNTVVELSDIAKTFTVEKNDESPLVIGHIPDQGIRLDSQFEDPEKINLRFEMEEGNLFSASAPISLVKPFANAAFGKKIFIKCDKFNPMTFHSQVDIKKIADADERHVEKCTYEIKLFVSLNTF